MEERNAEGCVKNQTVEKMQKFVLCFACTEIVLSLVFLIYGAATFIGVDQKVEAGEYDTNLKLEPNKFLGPLIIVAGLIGMIAGGTGLMAAKKQGLWACAFVVISLLIAIVCLVVGGVILGGNTVAQFKEQVCDRVDGGKKGSEKGSD